MGEIEFIFQIKDYDADALLPQVSKALQRRLQLRNQKVKPGVDPSKMTEEQLKQMQRNRKLGGFVGIALGLYLVISGLLRDGKLSAASLIGIVVIIWGIGRVMPKKEPSTDRFDKAAKEFLDGHRQNIGENEIQICFSDEEMIIVNGAVEDLDQEAVTYDEIEFAMETEDIFLLVHGGNGVMLQKKDIALGSVEEFRDFVEQHVRSFTPYEPEAVEGAEETAQPEEAEAAAVVDEPEQPEETEAE